VLAPLFGYDGSHRAQAALKRVTSVLTGRFVAETITVTRARYGPAACGHRPGGELTDPAAVARHWRLCISTVG